MIFNAKHVLLALVGMTVAGSAPSSLTSLLAGLLDLGSADGTTVDATTVACLAGCAQASLSPTTCKEM
jgi:hypothetical protein